MCQKEVFMGISGYVVNILSAVIAVEYMDYGFRKKYHGARRWGSFIVGCTVYFLTATTLNRMTGCEGVRSFFCGAVLTGYGLWALGGKIQDFLMAGVLWSLIVIAGTNGILLDKVGILVLIVQLYQRLGKYQEKKPEEQHLWDREQERQEELMDMYRIARELNHWRHDMLTEMDVLYCMQKNGKYLEVEACMEKLCSGLKDYPELPQPTGNEGLDAALMKMIPRCRERRIRFCYAVLGKPKQIDSLVLGNLMDNLLCNGMEACQNMGGAREMVLVLRNQGDVLEINLENSIGESVLENNPEFVSHKKVKERHGFGLESIRRIVKEYDGMYEYWEEKKGEGSIFCQWIYLGNHGTAA